MTNLLKKARSQLVFPPSKAIYLDQIVREAENFADLVNEKQLIEEIREAVYWYTRYTVDQRRPARDSPDWYALEMVKSGSLSIYTAYKILKQAKSIYKYWTSFWPDDGKTKTEQAFNKEVKCLFRVIKMTAKRPETVISCIKFVLRCCFGCEREELVRMIIEALYYEEYLYERSTT